MTHLILLLVFAVLLAVVARILPRLLETPAIASLLTPSPVPSPRPAPVVEKTPRLSEHDRMMLSAAHAKRQRRNERRLREMRASSHALAG